MKIWHMTADAGRQPLRVAPGQEVKLVIGTSPVHLNQTVSVTFDVIHADGGVNRGMVNARWDYNQVDVSYWSAVFGPFARGDRVTYWIHGVQGEERSDLPPVHFTVGPRICLALLWHQHQPSYVDLSISPESGITQPWVRLHALQAYYSMPALGAQIPDLRVTFNLTPVLLWQIDRYVRYGATDPLLDLTRRPAKQLSLSQRDRLLEQFFDADWHNQIMPFPRYLELFERRRDQLPFSDQDIRDLQMWYNLAWFAPEFREGTVDLVTGQQASVQRFVDQESGFSDDDIEAMIAEQYKIMAAILPLHRQLQEQGLIEVSTTPFYHPVLPLLYDTDTAIIDRPGACLPPRFSHPEDAEAQVARAIDDYRERFGRPPQGMWPAEGAISPETVPIYIRHGIRWIASDQGVLEASGRWGYDVGNPDVLAQPYQLRSDHRGLSVYFRDTGLSNLISFHYHQPGLFADMDQAAKDFVGHVLRDVADRLPGQEDRVVSVVLDGENTYSAYGLRAPAFLSALYRRLTSTPDIQTVTFAEYLQGDTARQLPPHPGEQQQRVYELSTGSWIDEAGSEPGVDLGTWLGEPEENRAWKLLGDARQALTDAGATPETNALAFDSLYMAEGSDWYWWLGTDHPAPKDWDFEGLFRQHLSNAYRFAGLEPPPELGQSILPPMLVWTFTKPLEFIRAKERLSVRTNCSGIIHWRLSPSGEEGETPLQPVSGLAAAAHRFEAALGPFGPEVREVRLRFECREHLRELEGACARPLERSVRVEAPEEGEQIAEMAQQIGET